MHILTVPLQSPPSNNNTRQEAIRTSGITPARSHAHAIQKLHTLTMILPSSPCSKSSPSSAGAPAAPRAAACFTILRLVPASSRSRGFPPISLGSPLPPSAMLFADLPAIRHAQLPTRRFTGDKLLHAATVTADMLVYDVICQRIPGAELYGCRAMHLLIRCGAGLLLLHCRKGLLLYSTQKREQVFVCCTVTTLHDSAQPWCCKFPVWASPYMHVLLSIKAERAVQHHSFIRSTPGVFPKGQICTVLNRMSCSCFCICTRTP